jgi:hypothetical protein
MIALMQKSRMCLLLLLGCTALCVSIHAQTAVSDSPTIQSTPPAVAPQPKPPSEPGEIKRQDETSDDKPLPDVVAMMHDVEINQRKAEAIEKNYMYHSVETEQEMDGHGHTKKMIVNEFDHYWVNGVRVRRLVKKNGKALTTDELAHEDERIDKEAAKAREKRDKGDAVGKQTDSRGNEEITVSRLLELGAFNNARRVQLNGRDTIAVDYVGDPRAKTRNRAEDAIRDLQGSAWIDEHDRILARVEGHFVNSFKVGGGLLVNIQKDTHFAMEQTKVNDEVWLPASIAAQGAARVLLFFNFSGNIRAVESDYRKFRATSTVLPGTTTIEPPQVPDSSAKP